MSNPRLAKGCVSKRQVTLTYGFNSKNLAKLIGEGVLQVIGGGIVESSLNQLQEGLHYVSCMECGARLASVSSKHTQYCSGLTLQAYTVKHPESRVYSQLSTQRKAKSPLQRERQSETLRARFQTEAGQVTRQQISEAAKRLQASGYKEQATEHLRHINAERRLSRSLAMQEAWAEGSLREVTGKWREENYEFVRNSAKSARDQIKSKVTKPHLILKDALVAAGFGDFQTEYSLGYYHIDEALPSLKVAVEMDGCYWHGCTLCGHPGLKENHALDKRKTSFLKNEGWVVLRIPEHEVYSDLSQCVEKIREAVLARKKELHGPED